MPAVDFGVSKWVSHNSCRRQDLQIGGLSLGGVTLSFSSLSCVMGTGTGVVRFRVGAFYVMYLFCSGRFGMCFAFDLIRFCSLSWDNCSSIHF